MSACPCACMGACSTWQLALNCSNAHTLTAQTLTPVHVPRLNTSCVRCTDVGHLTALVMGVTRGLTL
eukprot:119927-Pelagomonas_calceolata.AAC.1